MRSIGNDVTAVLEIHGLVKPDEALTQRAVQLCLSDEARINGAVAQFQEGHDQTEAAYAVIEDILMQHGLLNGQKHCYMPNE